MTRAIEQATKHFDNLINQKLNEYYVEEWDITVYYRTTLTWREQARILDMSTGGKTSDALIETVVIRCLEKDGKPMFTTADRTTLQNSVDPNTLLRIVGAINSTGDTLEEVEKN